VLKAYFTKELLLLSLLFNQIKIILRGAFDLHFFYTGFKDPSRHKEAVWIPIDPELYLPYHYKLNRVPCLFEPVYLRDNNNKKRASAKGPPGGKPFHQQTSSGKNQNQQQQPLVPTGSNNNNKTPPKKRKQRKKKNN
jgi:hypothetical protein